MRRYAFYDLVLQTERGQRIHSTRMNVPVQPAVTTSQPILLKQVAMQHHVDYHPMPMTPLNVKQVAMQHHVDYHPMPTTPDNCCMSGCKVW
jgi:hypothetical protein